jgi:hypothetical protein
MQQSKTNRPQKAEISQGALRRLEKRYHLLKSQLPQLGWIAQGSVCPQPPHAWRLTRKVKAKTISLALSAEQAHLYKEAILNNRQLEAILRKMREISEEVLQKSVPGVQKRPRQKLP